MNTDERMDSDATPPEVEGIVLTQAQIDEIVTRVIRAMQRTVAENEKCARTRLRHALGLER